MKKFVFLISLIVFCNSFLQTQTTIPVAVQISKTLENIDGTYYHLHTVEKGQTLYSISRAYDIAPEKIKRTIEKPDIQIGETLLIPASNQRMREVSNKPPKPAIDVALMLPLYLQNVAQIRVTPNMNRNAVKPFSFVSFYEGAMLAAQNFTDENVQINVHVFDVTEDENSAINLIESGELEHIDILVGPLFSRSFKVMSDFAKQHEIFIINPLSDRDDILANNPFVIKINTSEKNQLITLLNNVINKHIGHRILVLTNDSLPTESACSAYAKEFFEPEKSHFDSIIYIDISKEKFSKLQADLSTKTHNTIVYLSENEAFATQIFSQLSKREFGSVTLYCSQKLARFEVTESLYLNRLQTHYIEPFFIDYTNENVKNFDRLFFENFNTLPDVYAYRGYDVMSYVFELLKLGNTNYGNFLEHFSYKGFHNVIHLYRSNPAQGLENRETNLLKIEDTQLKKVNVSQ